VTVRCACADSGVDSLAQRAAALHLSHERAWHALVHYYKPPLGFAVESFIDSPGFFLAKEGKTDPEAELFSTIEHLFSKDEEVTDTSALCLYPARYEWLSSKLSPSFDDNRLSQCPKLSKWMKRHEDSRLTLVFATAFMKNPASMFGHTFLRFDSTHRSQEAPLLETTASFYAETEDSRGLLFAINGLFGGYTGRYGIASYDQLVRRYADIDSRDLWEYRLNLNTEQVRRLLLHLWELKGAGVDYFFIDENCSYHLLHLLEVANPDLHLSEQFTLYTLPTDTLSAVVDTESLLESVTFRPSLASKIRMQEASMRSEDVGIAKELSEGDRPVFPADWFDDQEQAAEVSDLAIDYIDYLKGKTKSDSLDFDTRYKELLELRSDLQSDETIGSDSDATGARVSTDRPDYGHGPRRTSLSLGYADSSFFLQPEFRFLYHDLLDPQEGYNSKGELEFMSLALRSSTDTENTALESLEIVNVQATPVLTQMMRDFSWAATAGINRRDLDSDERRLVSEGYLAGGVTYELNEKVQYSFFTYTELGASPYLDRDVALDLGGSIRTIVDISSAFRIQAKGKTGYQSISNTGNTFEYSLAGRYSLSRDVALLYELEAQEKYGHETTTQMLSLNYYF